MMMYDDNADADYADGDHHDQDDDDDDDDDHDDDADDHDDDADGKVENEHQQHEQVKSTFEVSFQDMSTRSHR